MLETIGTGLGGLLGGALGQAGEVLSAPRRALWSMLGLPETGAELVGQTFGLEPQSALARALGMGAEMILDPLTLGGMFLGGPASRILSNPWRRGAQLDEAVNTLRGAQRAGLMNVSQANQLAQEARAAVPGTAAMFNDVNLPGIAAGQMKTVKNVSPEAMAELGNLAVPMPEGGVGVLGGFANNRGLPGGVSYKPFAARPGHAGMRGTGLTGKSFEAPLPQLTPDELAMLSGQTGGQVDLARQLAVNRLAGALPAEPTMAQLLGGAGSRLAPEIAAMPVRQALDEVNTWLPQLMREQARYRITPTDIGMIGGAGLGALLGWSLGFQGY